MKKTLKIFIALLCSLSIITTVSFVTIDKVHADSGWDSDYDFDFGDSDWGTSDWGLSDYDWDSSSSSWGGGSSSHSGIGIIGGLFSIIFWVIVIVVVIAIASSSKSSKSVPYTYNNKEDNNNLNVKSYGQIPGSISNDEIHAVDPELDIDEFKRLANRTYLDVQNAWMEFDYDTLRKYTTDEIYNMYSMQLDTLKAKGQKNIMKDFFIVGSYISNIAVNNGIETIDVILTVKFLDYVVDSNNNVVRGSNNYRIQVTYKLTFVKSEKEVDEDTNYCPNCGAKLEDKASIKCPYCKAVIVADSYTWVMSKKESLEQRRG